MADEFDGHDTGLESPGRNVAVVTPNDSEDLPDVPRYLWVGVLGNVRVTLVGSGTETFVGVQGVLPVHAVRVLDTGTTATDVLAVW